MQVKGTQYRHAHRSSSLRCLFMLFAWAPASCFAGEADNFAIKNIIGASAARCLSANCINPIPAAVQSACSMAVHRGFVDPGWENPKNTAFDLRQVKFISGSENCQKNTDPKIQIIQYNAHSIVLRQNPCSHYEAPFLYLLIGQEKALLLDTGAGSANNLPLRELVMKLLAKWRENTPGPPLQLIVAHTHSHGDHTAHDSQFRGQENTIFIDSNLEDVKKIFGFQNWPEETKFFDLGNLALDIIPIPGHTNDSIAIYDRSSQTLLSGDTLYPGRLHSSNWNSFRDSIARLKKFSETHPIAQILGAHVEMMQQKGKDFPSESTHHPNEHALPLQAQHLNELYEAIQKMGDSPHREIHDDFIIDP